MKDHEEFEMLLNEIPHVTSINFHNLHHHQQPQPQPQPQHQQQQQQQQQQQTSHVNNHVHGDNGLGFDPTQMVHGVNNGRSEDLSLPNQQYVCVSPVSGASQQSEGCLLGTMHSLIPWTQFVCRMCIADDQQKGFSVPRKFPIFSNGVYGEEISNNGGLQGTFPTRSMVLNEERRAALLNLQQRCETNTFSGSYVSPDQLISMFSNLGLSSPYQQIIGHSVSNETKGNFKFQFNGDTGKHYNDIKILNPKLTPSTTEASMSNTFYYPNQIGLPISNRRVETSPINWTCQSLDNVSCEGSLILQEKSLSYVNKKKSGNLRDQKRHYYNNTDLSSKEILDNERSPSSRSYDRFLLPPRYNCLMGVQGYIYCLAKDQLGCRFLQQKFDEGSPLDVQILFNEIIDHVVELMMNPFGNYLIQKLLDVSNKEQRMHILAMVTSEPGMLVNISLNTHGTRVVQKIIDTLKTRQQITLIISALEPGFLLLIEDLNGNHVIQRCLDRLNYEDNKFIFNAAVKYCFEIATHRHGCCVLQKCIGHSKGKQREDLAAEISAKGYTLARHPYGNYVVQYVLDLRIPSVNATLISQFEGNYVQLSEQKFSSNVVEKCLNVFSEEHRSKIVYELLSVSKFGELLQDQYANYVINCALEVSKGALRALLVEAIRPHAALRTNPYCKRIFSKTLLK